MSKREETKMLIARQIAQFSGVNPVLLEVRGKIRDRFMTLAESILATVERKMGL